MCGWSANERTPMKTAIIGIGNPLWGDDGLGVHLAQDPDPGLPPNVEVIDGGTPGLDLLQFLEEYDRVIILDAVNHGGQPGDVIAFTPEETHDIPVCGSPSAHGLDLGFVLRMRDWLGCRAEVIVVGCEPLRCTAGEGLSEPVMNAIPGIWKEVQRELQVTSGKDVD
jgi:hydrogenase maturation protease